MVRGLPPPAIPEARCAPRSAAVSGAGDSTPKGQRARLNGAGLPEAGSTFPRPASLSPAAPSERRAPVATQSARRYETPALLPPFVNAIPSRTNAARNASSFSGRIVPPASNLATVRRPTLEASARSSSVQPRAARAILHCVTFMAADGPFVGRDGPGKDAPNPGPRVIGSVAALIVPNRGLTQGEKRRTISALRYSQ